MNDTQFIRLNSPNYNGSYDFNVAKNEGVDYFTVNFTYKPYTPFIHIAPNFKGLYGQDFDDARGLICGGDFSISILNNAWTQYELNNKNFQKAFDTQIQTQDYAHRMGMISQGIGSMALGGVGSGLAAGFALGPVAGVAFGAASIGAGAADLAIGSSVYQRNKQGAIDQFNYQLGNVKARPNSLSRVGAYNIKNKYFPFIEFYGATEAEETAFKNKLKYEGMTVMTIGKISEYIGKGDDFNYFKGSLIQAGDISEDFHMADTISVELEKGLYID